MTERSHLALLALLALVLSGCVARSCGLQPVRDCPEQTLTTEEVQALYTEGLAITQRDMMGEHYHLGSIAEGLPLLERAALHGHREAMKAYRGHFIRVGALEMQTFDGLLSPDATAEGMMWVILGAHLGEPVQAHDTATFEVLMDPALPFPEGFFDSPSGTAWMFQMLTERGLDWAREQAYAWRGCWSK